MIAFDIDCLQVDENWKQIDTSNGFKFIFILFRSIALTIVWLDVFCCFDISYDRNKCDRWITKVYLGYSYYF